MAHVPLSKLIFCLKTGHQSLRKFLNSGWWWYIISDWTTSYKIFLSQFSSKVQTNISARFFGVTCLLHNFWTQLKKELQKTLNCSYLIEFLSLFLLCSYFFAQIRGSYSYQIVLIKQKVYGFKTMLGITEYSVSTLLYNSRPPRTNWETCA